MPFGIQTLKRKAREAGIHTSNRAIERVVARVETIQAQSSDRPATEDEAIALGIRFLMHSDPTGETAVANVMASAA